MSPKTIHRPRSVWIDTLVVAPDTDTRVAQFAYPIPTDQPTPTAKLPAEEEADRWVEQQLFNHYNS